jgi:RimJ/RimL family protein N-acetyltransferase
MTARLADTPVLETARFRLRAPHAGDAAAWAAFFTSHRARFIGGGAEETEGRAWRAFAGMVGHWALRGFGTFVIEDRASGAPLGATGPWYPGDWPEREIGWTLWSAEAEGRGVMAEAVPPVLDHAFGPLGWDTAVSYIDPANARSIALAERLGARLDPAARTPRDEGGLVYRHARPGAPA